MSSRMQYRMSTLAAGLTADALFRTCRWERYGADRYTENWATNSGLIFAHWHGRLLPLTYYHRGRGIAPLVSRSADGEYISKLIEHWGFHPVRGSSSRGGTAALREMVRVARKGRMLVFTPDGPRGPREEVKHGVLIAAQLSGLPIVPASAAASRAWWITGWDRFLVPKPFARIMVGFGEPMYVPRNANESQLNAYAAQLKASIDALTRQLDDAVA
ncbi:MAG: lysophospholipid acyltransferase family protein [Longimicrobiales bacterium]